MKERTLHIYLGVFLLSAATLAFEITLTRIFSVAQWYHFAFMTVSIALLGFGASGSFLALFPARLSGSADTSSSFRREDFGELSRAAQPEGSVETLTEGSPKSTFWKYDINHVLILLSALFSLSVVGSYLTINYLPFDSYRIAWERRQLAYLAIYYLSLAIPFFFSGLSIGVLLSAWPTKANRIYSFNLTGSGMGCLLAVGVLSLTSGAGAVLFAAWLGLLAALAFRMQRDVDRRSRITSHASWIVHLAILALLAFLTLHPPAALDVRMSPYKTLSNLLRYPDTRLVFTRWNAFSRVDVVESRAIKSAPGLSFAYKGLPPPQMGLTVDGDNLSPITATDLRSITDSEFVEFLPTSLPYRLVPKAKTLIIEPRGGLDVLVALHHGASSITVVEDNPLMVEVVRDRYGDFAGGIYSDSRVRVVVENGRSYARRSGQRFDLVQLSLTDTFKVITFGAYSLTENYIYTVEAFQDFYGHLAEGGLLVVARWLQLPPSEEVRTGAIAVEALERLGVERPAEQMVAFRSFQTMTLLVKRGAFTAEEIQAVKTFCEEKRFDLVYYPGMSSVEANRYNVLPEPYYYQAFNKLLFGGDRARFYADYPYDVFPSSDDRPFFFHFFKWSQIPTIMQSFGKTWQPFGGSGYLVLVILLVLALLASTILILLPLPFGKGWERAPFKGRVFLYFFLLGIGYLFVEMPLMQKFIFFLGHPIYAFAAVLFAMLVFSGLGSLASPRFPLSWALAALCVAILLYPFLLPPLLRLLLGLSLTFRLLTAVLILAPLGFLMGMPFPKGIEVVNEIAPGLIPWAWGINGCASVLSSILSVMIAISFGFSWVLVGASAAYALGLGAIHPLAGLGYGH